MQPEVCGRGTGRADRCHSDVTCSREIGRRPARSESTACHENDADERESNGETRRKLVEPGITKPIVQEPDRLRAEGDAQPTGRREDALAIGKVGSLACVGIQDKEGPWTTGAEVSGIANTQDMPAGKLQGLYATWSVFLLADTAAPLSRGVVDGSIIRCIDHQKMVAVGKRTRPDITYADIPAKKRCVHPRLEGEREE